MNHISQSKNLRVMKQKSLSKVLQRPRHQQAGFQLQRLQMQVHHQRLQTALMETKLIRTRNK